MLHGQVDKLADVGTVRWGMEDSDEMCPCRCIVDEGWSRANDLRAIFGERCRSRIAAHPVLKLWGNRRQCTCCILPI